MKAPIGCEWFLVLIFVTSPTEVPSSPKEKNSQDWKHLWLQLTRRRWSRSVDPHQRTWCSPGPRSGQPPGPWRPSSPGRACLLCWREQAGGEFQLAVCFPQPRKLVGWCQGITTAAGKELEVYSTTPRLAPALGLHFSMATAHDTPINDT